MIIHFFLLFLYYFAAFNIKFNWIEQTCKAFINFSRFFEAYSMKSVKMIPQYYTLAKEKVGQGMVMHWCHSDVWHLPGQQFFSPFFSLCTFCRAEYASYARSTLFHVGFTQEAEWEVQPWRGEYFFKPLSDAWNHLQLVPNEDSRFSELQSMPKR